MREIKYSIVILLLNVLSVNVANAQLGGLSKRIKNKTENINKGNKDVRNKMKKADKMIVPSLSTFPALVQTDAYKEQVRSSGAASRINRLDQLIVLYLRDKNEWKAKGFNSYRGFLNSKISRVETGKKGVFEQAPTWYVLPFYQKVLKDMKSELKGATEQNEVAENEAEEAANQAARDKEAADSLAYVQKIDEEFNFLKKEGPHQPEQPIKTDFHRKHVGQLVFSKTPISIDNPSETQLTTNFTSNDEIHMRGYLEKALRNTYYKPDNPKKEIYKDLLLSPQHLSFTYYVDGKEVENKNLFVSMSNKTKDGLERTSFSHSWHYLDHNGYYFPERFIKFARALSKGKHTIRIEAYVTADLTFKDPDIQKQAYFEENYYIRQDLYDSSEVTVKMDDRKNPIFAGEFTIDIQGPMTTGRKWSHIKSGKMNSNSSVKAALRKQITNDDTEIVDLKILSDDYRMVRNKYSGVVMARFVTVAVLFKSSRDGLIYSGMVDYKQEHNGSSFQNSWIQDGNWFKINLADRQ